MCDVDVLTYPIHAARNTASRWSTSHVGWIPTALQVHAIPSRVMQVQERRFWVIRGTFLGRSQTSELPRLTIGTSDLLELCSLHEEIACNRIDVSDGYRTVRRLERSPASIIRASKQRSDHTPSIPMLTPSLTLRTDVYGSVSEAALKESLRGKVALVTGSSRGIGKHIAHALAAAGASVALTGRDESSLKEACEEVSSHGTTCCYYVADVLDDSDMWRLASDVG